MSKPDWYALLGISPDASPPEIKKAYRRQLKLAHPDVNRADPKADERVRQLVLAYQTLIDPESRRLHDKLRPQEGFRYRDFLINQNTPEATAKLILFDLLHERETDACQTYGRFLVDGFQLIDYLDREAYMDCAYMLAEELSFRDQPDLAFSLVRAIIRLELQRPYFRHFFPEVIELAEIIVSLGVRQRQADQALSWLEDLISSGLSQRETATWLIRAAELYLSRNETARAAFYMEEGERLFKGVPGLNDLKKKIEIRRQAVWRK